MPTTTTHSDLPAIPDLDLALDATMVTGVPLMLWGPPGVGKSAAIRNWTERRGLACWTVIASLREPSDFNGMPIAVPAATDDASSPPSVTFAPPRFAREAAAQGGVIFLDELTTAPPAVQAALLRAVQERAFGDLELDPTRVAIIAAANPPAEAAGGWDLTPPLANRFLHVDYPLDPVRWAMDFPGYWGKPPTLSFHDRSVPEARWARIRAVTSAFIRARPDLLLQLPVEASERGRSWPSPRTWDMATRLLAGGDHLPWHRSGGPPASGTDILLPLLAGAVGQGAATEFIAWLSDLTLPDPEELLAEPARYRHPARGDQAYAILTAVVQATLADLTEPRWTAAWTIIGRAAAGGGKDMAAAACVSLARARGRHPGWPVPKHVLAEFAPLMQAAGA